MKNKLFLVSVIALLLLVNLGQLSALEFDNVKSLPKGVPFQVGDKTLPDNPIWNDYAPIEIKNSFGLGRTLFRGAITKHDYTCGESCNSELTVYTDGTYPLIDSVDFYTIQDDGSRVKQNVRSYQFYYWGTINDYEYQCEEVGIYAENGTKIQECNNVQIGSHEGWIAYSLGTKLPEGTYEIKLDAEKKPSRTVDWVIKTSGETINEWAVWGSIGGGDDAEVILHSPADASEGAGAEVTFNASVNITGGSSLTNMSLWTNETGTWGQKNITTIEGSSGAGLVGGGTVYYKLDEPSGTTAYDYLGNYDGSTGGVRGVDGQVSYGTSLNGVTNHITTQQINADVDWTVMGWFKFNSVTGSALWSDDEHTMFEISSGKIRCGVDDGVSPRYVQSATTLTTGVWYHIACLRDRSDNVTIYINGVLDATTPKPFDAYDRFGTANFGCGYAVSGCTNGTYDELGLWNGLLTEANIQTIYNASKSKYEFTQDWTRTIPSGIIWNVQGCDSDGDCGFATSNYSLFLDSTAPTVNILTPSGLQDYGAVGDSVSVTFNAADASLDDCWYNYNGTNITTPSCNNFSITLEEGNYDIIVYANDTIGNEASDTSSWSYKVVEISREYESTTYETTEETFRIDVSYNYSVFSAISGSLIYNGTSYSTTRTGSEGNYNFTSNVTIPTVSAETINSFYWSFALTNATGTYYVNTTSSNQTVNVLNAISIGTSCAAGFSPGMFFNFSDSINKTAIQNISAQYILRYGKNVNDYKTISGSLTDVNNITFCLNTTISDRFIVNYGEIQYEKTGYSDRRYYLFTGSQITNTSSNKTLYLLPTASTTNFLFTIQDGASNAYKNKYITLNRWYPASDEYLISEIGKTDDKGQTVLKIETDDVDYRLGIYDTDGTLIHMVNPLRLVCLANPCSYTITVPGTRSAVFENYLGLDYSLTYNQTTGIFTFIFSDPSQNTDTIRLEVLRITGAYENVICNSSTTGNTGVLICDASGYTGVLKAVAYRTASPENPIASKIFQVQNSSLKGDVGLFITFMILITLSLIGLFSPMLTVILSLISLIPAIVFGIVPLQIFMLICAMGFIVLHFMRRSAQG